MNSIGSTNSKIIGLSSKASETILELAKEYTDSQLSKIKRFKLVQGELPENDIDENAIYLKPIITNGAINNSYEEYLYINNTWELIGSTNIDLDNY